MPVGLGSVELSSGRFPVPYRRWIVYITRVVSFSSDVTLQLLL